MDIFEEATLNSKIDTASQLDLILATFKRHNEVWKDLTTRKMTINTMLRIGTNAILNGDDVVDVVANLVTSAISILEHYDSGDYLWSAIARRGPAMRDTKDGGERGHIRLFSKRISCDCLKKKYSLAKKTKPNIGK